VTVVALISVVLRTVDDDGRVLVWRDRATGFTAYNYLPAARLAATCSSMRDVAERSGSSLVVVLVPHLTYPCGALEGGAIETLLPVYERRTWRMYEELRRRRSAVVLWGVGNGFCDVARPRVLACRSPASHAVVIRMRPQTALALLESLEVPTRQFGPRCHLHGPYLKRSCTHPLELSSSQLVTGPPPADPAASRAAVERATASMFRPTRGGDHPYAEQAAEVLRDGGACVRGAVRALRTARVRVHGIMFLDDRQAAIRLVVDEGGRPPLELGGRAVRRSRWVVSRGTFFRAAAARCPGARLPPW
jgi:hypothetical protein